jgi:hypothetical protein
MIRIWTVLCFLLCAICTGAAMSFEGSGTGSYTDKFKVKGCGSYKGGGAVSLFQMESGNWSITTPSRILTGTYDQVKAGKKFNLSLDQSSHSEFLSFLKAESSDLCGSAPDSNNISSLVFKKFRVKLNKKQTKAKLKLKIKAIRSDGAGSSKVIYRLKAATNFKAFSCGSKPIKAKDGQSWVTAVTAPDLNADGASDLVFTQHITKFVVSNVDLNDNSADVKSLVSSQVVIYLQDKFAAGVFHRSPDIPILPRTEVNTAYRELLAVADGDLDGDGIIDIVVPEKGLSLVGVLPQDPGNPGTFLQLKNLPAPLAPVDVAIGDINGDGINDIAVAGGDLSLLINDSSSPGDAFYELALGTGNVTSVAIADIDGDGRSDLATTTRDSVIVLLQDPAPSSPGSFTVRLPYAAGADTADVTIGDLNGDTLPDLAVASRGITDGSVLIYIQDPAQAGRFLPGVDYQTGGNSQRVKIRDLNNDALPDLAVANNDYEGGSVSVLLQNDLLPGVFLAPDNYPGLLGPEDIATEDMNRDGLADLVVADKCHDQKEGPYIRYQSSDSPGSFLPPVYLP